MVSDLKPGDLIPAIGQPGMWRVTYVAVGPYVRSDGKGVIPGITFVRVEKE